VGSKVVKVRGGKSPDPGGTPKGWRDDATAVLHGITRGESFSIMLTALYSALYGLLVSEDNALLLGSLLVFTLIATAMLLTRNVDWYRVDAHEADSPRQRVADG
jgi:inner membrane protein involved in colicin E2 resistance